MAKDGTDGAEVTVKSLHAALQEVEALYLNFGLTEWARTFSQLRHTLQERAPGTDSADAEAAVQEVEERLRTGWQAAIRAEAQERAHADDIVVKGLRDLAKQLEAANKEQRTSQLEIRNLCVALEKVEADMRQAYDTLAQSLDNEGCQRKDLEKGAAMRELDESPEEHSIGKSASPGHGAVVDELHSRSQAFQVEIESLKAAELSLRDAFRQEVEARKAHALELEAKDKEHRRRIDDLEREHKQHIDHVETSQLKKLWEDQSESFLEVQNAQQSLRADLQQAKGELDEIRFGLETETVERIASDERLVGEIHSALTEAREAADEGRQLGASDVSLEVLQKFDKQMRLIVKDLHDELAQEIQAQSVALSSVREALREETKVRKEGDDSLREALDAREARDDSLTGQCDDIRSALNAAVQAHGAGNEELRSSLDEWRSSLAEETNARIAGDGALKRALAEIVAGNAKDASVEDVDDRLQQLTSDLEGEVRQRELSAEELREMQSAFARAMGSEVRQIREALEEEALHRKKGDEDAKCEWVKMTQEYGATLTEGAGSLRKVHDAFAAAIEDKLRSLRDAHAALAESELQQARHSLEEKKEATNCEEAAKESLCAAVLQVKAWQQRLQENDITPGNLSSDVQHMKSQLGEIWEALRKEAEGRKTAEESVRDALEKESKARATVENVLRSEMEALSKALEDLLAGDAGSSVMEATNERLRRLTADLQEEVSDRTGADEALRSSLEANIQDAHTAFMDVVENKIQLLTVGLEEETRQREKADEEVTHWLLQEKQVTHWLIQEKRGQTEGMEATEKSLGAALWTEESARRSLQDDLKQIKGELEEMRSGLHNETAERIAEYSRLVRELRSGVAEARKHAERAFQNKTCDDASRDALLQSQKELQRLAKEVRDELAAEVKARSFALNSIREAWREEVEERKKGDEMLQVQNEDLRKHFAAGTESHAAVEESLQRALQEKPESRIAPTPLARALAARPS
eukprot:gnl/TRDRNA2_/TRDRNA2_148270_c2_seq1.p1 gnl/TRDRNA2_/TRDRNA2_148270_c2~~gnl/TRDRNA2_/TRDRNA2_148270_c2_seq1.p1  ORF type:complete len:1077 (-),score=315.69 gnl/TRDRNA2_/TRDRNA2_148270_c2_seq1:210-3179(-)